MRESSARELTAGRSTYPAELHKDAERRGLGLGDTALTPDCSIDEAVTRGRALAWSGDIEAAKAALVEALRLDSTHFEALNDLGALACATGHRSAARTVYRQALRFHPSNAIGRVNLANMLVEDGELAEAREHYLAALELAPDLPEAHQGLARVFAALGDEMAETHFRRGFAARAELRLGYRGIGPAVPVVLLVSVRLGNMQTRQWLGESLFDVTAIHVVFWDQAAPLPRHALIVNAIGDADLCGAALLRAERMFARGAALGVNPPARVAATGRAQNARRLGAISGVVAPEIAILPRADIPRADRFRFPLLLRTPGFHTGLNFVRVEDRRSLAAAVEALPGDELMAIEYLDARGRDGLARKYRVMAIDGKLFPLHLAISRDWKVHYFTAAMAEDATHRAEEMRFLEDMPRVLGERAMAALEGIVAELDLDYVGVDFGLAPDGSLLLFEANAAMVVIAPPPETIWDYRRRPVADILAAAKQMALSRALAAGRLSGVSE